ncbi:conserved oligomeric Golgi complex subunit 1-like [Agrilus planipennis]|uniref:Conserved oligomeric Golgi complex subunit 1 n=1 Tax=Agrilus planipennis TaxID=224129 RepID=A0A7F5R6S4_AGRPL|nr:conserved oligomeric Golgi complex subunit 1-like [Agrilus planipennis]
MICDKLRSKVDPFDLDVLYKPLLNNVKYSVLQTQVIFGCLLPSAEHLANIGTGEKREQENEPSIITFSVPSGTVWFPLLPVTAPAQKVLASTGAQTQKQKSVPKPSKIDNKKSTGDVAGMVRSGTAALFGAMANEWFS